MAVQSLPTDSAQRDTHNLKVVPIIVVPGVMGSRVSLRAGAAPVWDPDNDAQMLLWTAETNRRKQALLDPARTAGELVRKLGSKAHSAVLGSDVRRVAARENPSVVVRPSTGRNSNAVTAAAQLVQYYERRGWGTVSWGFYGELLLRLELDLNPGGGTLQFPVYACGYDWRQSNTQSGARLATEIGRILGQHPLARQVVVVTHSMGGLVLRASLPQAESRILGVVHTVLPADGAVVAYRRFITGATTPFDAPVSAFPSPVESLAARVLNRIMGSDPVAYSIVQSGLRGPVELLPNNNFNSTFLEMGDGRTNQTVGDVYDIYAREGPPGILPRPGAEARAGDTWSAADAAELRGRIAGARELHRALGQRFHPNTFAVYGDALRTDTNFNWNAGLVNQVGDEDDLRLKITQHSIDSDPDNDGIGIVGDGTVPAISARLTPLDPDRRFRINRAEHAGCFTSAAFMSQTLDCLQRLLLG